MKSVMKSLLAAGLLLVSANTMALEQFEQFGVINKLNYSGFIVSGQKYRIAPGAKLRSNDASRKRLSDFRQGDRIYFKGKILNNAYLVYLVVYERPTPS